MFGFVAYYDENENDVLITHLPLKDVMVEKNNLVKMIQYSHKDINKVSLVLDSFLSGIKVISKIGGHVDVNIVPEMQKLFKHKNINSQKTESMITTMGKIYPSLNKMNCSNTSIN